ncbi:transcriptional regulator, LysR family [Pseudodesulfovibrio mercurii]|uniref:Transcriptional regulator, LysR family n=1 Tax=Pseudodesulfovibrio mercurii TaxID=641491 RepID=F0JE29_9BACT|nr:LysR substrate-binding domain-containing protein [Pseudodesulfovibrio mercurii]EGB14638.1 transcriptional regulator, LysR family [Pseudodesulfovibrio mercurii]
MEKLKSLDSLRFFSAAARNLSFTGAAAELGISQSAVSQQVAKLEAGIGFRLFERRARGLALTDKGARLWTAVREGLGRIEQTLQELDDTRQLAQMTVRALPSFAARWLLPRVIKLRQWAPELNIVVDADLARPDFLHDGVDVAFTYGKTDHPEWDQSFLFHDAIFPVCTPDFMREHALNTPRDLRGGYLLHDSVPQAIYSTNWDAWFAALGMSLPQDGAGPAFSTLAMVCESALAGQGVALSRYSLVADDLAAGRLVRPFEQVTLEDGFYLACPKSSLKRVAIRKFYEWAKEQAALFRGGMVF